MGQGVVFVTQGRHNTKQQVSGADSMHAQSVFSFCLVRAISGVSGASWHAQTVLISVRLAQYRDSWKLGDGKNTTTLRGQANSS